MPSEKSFNYRGEYDENLPLPRRLTREQYNHVIFRPDAHFVDGDIIPRKFSDYAHHEALGRLRQFSTTLCDQTGASACVSLRLAISSSRVRVCDFVALKRDAPRESVPTVPPELCVEILTSTQQPEDEIETLKDYFAMGVPNIWLIDPIRHKAYTFDGEGLRECSHFKLAIRTTTIEFDITKAFVAFS